MSATEQSTKIIELPASITVRELGMLINVSPIDIIKVLMANGVMANINQQIDYDTAAIVASAPAPAPMSKSTPESGKHVTMEPAMSPSAMRMILTPICLRDLRISLWRSRSSMMTVNFSIGMFFALAIVRTISSVLMSIESLPMLWKSVAILK